MNGSLKIRTTLDYSSIPSSHYLDSPLHALIEIEPDPAAASAGRLPLNLVLVVDASATMYSFQLSEDERDYWMGLAISRDDLERGEADESDATYWTGQTLLDMQGSVHTPMSLAVDSIKQLLSTLQPGDQVAVFAFADRPHTVFTQNDWANFPDGCLTQLDLLGESRLPVDIGTGTHMAEAIRQASQSVSGHAQSPAVSRLIVISDGIVQDRDAALKAIDESQSQGQAITTIGVGDEFDEEFLTQIADSSRGDYHYAADSAAIARSLTEEMATLESTTVTDLHLAVRGLEGAVVQDLYLVRPTMTQFDEIQTEDGWLRVRLGNVSSAAPASIIVQVAPPILPSGRHDLVDAQLTWTSPGGAAAGTPGNAQAVVSAEFTDGSGLSAAPNPEVQDLVDRYAVYKYEREAQRAQEKGDIETAREKLGAATRQLHKLGEDELAADMESELAGLGTAANPARLKRIKATTRRLAGSPHAETHTD